VVGSPFANRPWPHIEPLVGFLVNTLALRCDQSGAPTFLELLRLTRETVQAASQNQDLALEELVEELHPGRDLSRPPLLLVMLALKNIPTHILRIDQSSVSPRDIDVGTAKLDLQIQFDGRPDGDIDGRLIYDTDLLATGDAHRMVQHWNTLHEGIAQDGVERPISEVPY
jgi:non-ribosomal peptide synthetase component F